MIKSKKILIVDDEEDILALLAAVLGYLDQYTILGAKDGEEGLRMAEQENPALVLLDIQMPKLSGYEVCRAIRANKTLSGTKILILSGLTQPGDFAEAEQAGADDFLPKPFDLDTLTERVEALLKGR